MKICSKCGKAKSSDAFGPRAGNRDGLQSQCRGCKAAYHSEYREINAEKVLEYREANMEQERARSTKYRVAHPDRRVASTAKYNATHPEAKKESSARWAREHSEERVAWWAEYNARKLAAPGRGITADEWLEILAAADGICAYCETPAKLTMDHVVPLILGGAHDVDNIAAACGPCNSSKGSRPLVVFLQGRAQSQI